MTAQSMAVTFAGEDVTLFKVAYRGQATTFSVDYRTVAVGVVAPASGPTLTLGSSVTNQAKTVTVAAGGAHKSGYIIVAAGNGAS
jgi:hypothetical protein